MKIIGKRTKPEGAQAEQPVSKKVKQEEG